MKKALFLFSLASLSILVSCGDDKIQEGEIEYVVTYPYAEISGLMQAILPEKATLVFKGTKMKTNISRGKIFTTDVISNEADRTVEMRLDFGDKLFYTELNGKDIEKLKASQPKYSVSATSKQDSIQGLWATEYTVKSDPAIVHSNAWFTEDLAPQEGYWYSSYYELKGIPLIYDVERYGIIMHLEAVKFTKREVLDTEFDRDPSLSKVTFDQYESEVQELFDILMD